MPLRRRYTKTVDAVRMKSGHFYKFRYRPYERDPNPVIIFMHSIEGIHPNSGHQWRILQAINFSYVPRSFRKRFLGIWMKEMERPGNIKFHWQKVLAQYPYIKTGIRRYFYTPTTYISKMEEIPDEKIHKEVVKGLIQDFSKKVTIGLRGRFAKMRQEREKKRKAKEKKRKILIKQREAERKRAFEKERKRNTR